jgi:hypothetical protein
MRWLTPAGAVQCIRSLHNSTSTFDIPCCFASCAQTQSEPFVNTIWPSYYQTPADDNMFRPIFNVSVTVPLQAFVLRCLIHIPAGSSTIVAKIRDCESCVYCRWGTPKVKVKVTLEHAMKAHWWSRSMALFLL